VSNRSKAALIRSPRRRERAAWACPVRLALLAQARRALHGLATGSFAFGSELFSSLAV
jgi:hypothetical protein